jgi:hypothetical protein
MPDLLLNALDLFGDPVWGGVALAVVILVLALGFLAKIINSGTTGDLTCDELRLLEDVFSDLAGGGVYALCSGSEREELAVQGFLDGLVRGTKTVMTRVELGGTLYLVAVVGVLLTSRKEESES